MKAAQSTRIELGIMVFYCLVQHRTNAADCLVLASRLAQLLQGPVLETKPEAQEATAAQLIEKALRAARSCLL